MTSLSDEARKSVQDAVDALRQWRNEIDAVNERGLTRAMERIETAQQAMGWPNRVTTDTGPSAVLPGKMHYFMVLDAVREELRNSSKKDMRVIDKVAEACYASLQPNAFFPSQTSGSPQVASIGAASVDIPKRNRLPILAGVLVALGAIGYATYDRVTQPISYVIDKDRFVGGAATNQKSTEATASNETPVPPSPQTTVIPQRPEEIAPPPQSANTAESPSTTSPPKVTVSLGVLASKQLATKKWHELQALSGELFTGHVPVITKAKRRSGTVWLMEIRDFSDRREAVEFCERLHRKAAQCDIRETE